MRHQRGGVAITVTMLLSFAAATAHAGQVDVEAAGDSFAHLGFYFRDARWDGTFEHPLVALNEPNNLVIKTTTESIATFQDNRTIRAVDTEYGHPHDCVASGWRAVCQDSGFDVVEAVAYLEGAGDRATVSGGAAAELHGGPGNDTLIDEGTPGSVLLGDAGNDYLQGGPGNDRLFDDDVTIDPGDDVLKGAGGNDTIISAQGSDRIDAGAGDDDVHIRAAATPVSITCGSGNDSLALPAGSPIVPPLDCENVYYS